MSPRLVRAGLRFLAIPGTITLLILWLAAVLYALTGSVLCVVWNFLTGAEAIWGTHWPDIPLHWVEETSKKLEEL